MPYDIQTRWVPESHSEVSMDLSRRLLFLVCGGHFFGAAGDYLYRGGGSFRGGNFLRGD